MTRYISNEANLKMMMNLLRDKSKNIQFEAFHVFKVGPSIHNECGTFRRLNASVYDPLVRCLSPTQRSRRRLRAYSAAIKTSCCSS